MSVVSMIVGAVAPDTARVVTKVSAAGNVRLVVSLTADMTSPTFYGPVTPDAQNVGTVTATGLTPSTRYWWRIEHAGVIDTAVTGQFRTHPKLGEPASFEVAVSSCAGASPATPGTGAVLAGSRLSNHTVFDAIRTRSPLIYVNVGDLHYYDLSSGQHGIVGGASVSNFRRAYDDILLQPRQHQLYREVPFSYTWDDHDFLGNESAGASDPTGAANALSVYKERVPHYPLAKPADGIYQSWEIGRVLFVALDGRSKRSANTDPDGPSKTMLGATQKAWLQTVLDSSQAEYLVLLMGSQWTGTTHPDSWASFATERTEIRTMFADTGWINRMCAVYGDRHAFGVDSGGGNADGGFPLLLAGSLDSTPTDPPSDRFDLGLDFPGRGQFGTIGVKDWGFGLAVTLSGWRGATLLRSHTHTVNISTPMTPTLLRSVSGSHRATFEARVVTDFPVGDDPAGTEIPILSGDVKLDGTAEIRGTLDLATDGNGTWPAGAGALLAPYGNEIFVRRGIDLGSHVEWVPLGYFRIDSDEQDDAPDGPIDLTGSDRMAGIVDARLTGPRQYDATRTIGSVFRELVGEVHPGAVMFFEDQLDKQLLGRSVVAEESRYALLADIAASRGKLLYFDGAGVLQIAAPPDPGTPVWEVAAGRNGVLVAAARRLSREGVYNAVVAVGEAADTENPARAVVVNSNPRSATWWEGRFGKVPRFYASPLITTDLQAQSAAQAILRRSIGFPYSADFTAVPNPALQPHDPVRITHADGTRETHVMQSVTIPLTADAPIAGTTKEQTLVILGAG